jgi:hypothetical protein
LLREYPNKLTIRYEDLILNPAVIATLFSEYIGLQKMEGVSSIQYLKENTEMAGNTAGNMIPSMHNLRNFDPASIGKWKNDPLKAEYINSLLQTSPYRFHLKKFMETHGYEDKEKTVAGKFC